MEALDELLEISIHALREEGDVANLDSGVPDGISIHALREEGDLFRSICKEVRMISIHALREEGDAQQRAAAIAVADFYPRPPRGGRPLCDHCRLPPALISIHALREEGDLADELRTTGKV